VTRQEPEPTLAELVEQCRRRLVEVDNADAERRAREQQTRPPDG